MEKKKTVMMGLLACHPAVLGEVYNLMLKKRRKKAVETFERIEKEVDEIKSEEELRARLKGALKDNYLLKRVKEKG